MTLSVRALAGLVLLALSVSAADAGGIRLTAEDVALEASPEVEIDRAKARALLVASRKSFAIAANELSAPSKVVFRAGRDLPFWMPETRRRTARITVELRKTVDVSERGYTAILSRLAAADARILLLKPAGETAFDSLHELSAEMARAVVAHGLGPGAPIWFREGFALAMAEIATEGNAARTKSLNEKLAALGDGLDVKAVLAAGDPAAFRAAAGPAVSRALVRLLRACRPEMVPSLFNQSRILLDYVAGEPAEGAARDEFTHLMLMELAAAGATVEVLQKALSEWIAAGLPEDAELRKTNAYRTLKRLKLPQRYGIGMKGGFSLRWWDEDEQETVQPVKKMELAWRLPWSTSMEVTAVLSNRAGFRVADLSSRRAGAIVEPLDSFVAKPRGTRKIRGTILRHKRTGYLHGTLFLTARTPAGIVYVRRLRQKLKR